MNVPFFRILSGRGKAAAPESSAPKRTPPPETRRAETGAGNTGAGNDSARKCRARKPTGDAALRHPPFCVPETADQSVTGISLFTFFEPTRA